MQNPVPIFHQDWWLTIASHGTFSSIDTKMGSKTVSRFPFIRKKTLGSYVIRMPKYTRTLGPYLTLPPSKTFRREQNIRHVVEKTVARLPKHGGVNFYLAPGDETALAFKLSGFTLYEDFTFRIQPEKSLEAVWQDCDQKTRNLIRTGDKKLSVQRSQNIEGFIALAKRELSHCHHDFKLLRALFEAACTRDQAMALYAYDGKELVAAALLIWDDMTLYYWQSARAHASQVPGMNMLLIWKAIELAKERNLTFDFDGFGSARVARMLASFGQRPSIRTQVCFATPLYRIKKRISDFVKKHISKKHQNYDFF